MLEGHQIIKRVGPVEFAGVDEAHVNVADSGPVKSFKAQGVLPVQDRHLESTLGDIMPLPILCRVGCLEPSSSFENGRIR